MLRCTATRDPGDSLAGEQPESGSVVLRYPKAADILHAQLKLFRRLRYYTAGLLRRAATVATPHAQQLGLQPHQRRLPQRIEQVHPLAFPRYVALFGLGKFSRRTLRRRCYGNSIGYTFLEVQRARESRNFTRPRSFS